jgi:ABC-type glycerol-3-phosphate transport system substrate-binding protein
MSHMSRRTLLSALAAAASACLMPGCANVTSTLLEPHLVIADDVLYTAREQLLAAWSRHHRAGSLRIIRQPISLVRNSSGAVMGYTFAPAASYNRAGDIIGVPSSVGPDPDMVPLGPYLKGHNVSLDSFVGASAKAFLLDGTPFALPIALSEIQFAVNHSALRRLGFPAPASGWSVDTMAAAIKTAIRRNGPYGPSSPPPIVGITWADVRIWGAFVIGAGGSLPGYLGNKDSTSVFRFIDLNGALTATETAVAFARECQWAPPQPPPWSIFPDNFPQRGFTGPYTNSLFAFLPPAALGVNVPVSLSRDLFVTLPSEHFPTLWGNRRVIPAWTTQGLSISPASRNKSAAADLLLWLYNPSQQRALASAGVPPVLDDQGLLDYWHLLQSRTMLPGRRFDFNGYLDVIAELPVLGANMPASINYDSALIPALAQAYAGQTSVGQALGMVAAQIASPTFGIIAPPP